jgi:hypothetical protein
LDIKVLLVLKEQLGQAFKEQLGQAFKEQLVLKVYRVQPVLKEILGYKEQLGQAFKE